MMASTTFNLRKIWELKWGRHELDGWGDFGGVFHGYFLSEEDGRVYYNKLVQSFPRGPLDYLYLESLREISAFVAVDDSMIAYPMGVQTPYRIILAGQDPRVKWEFTECRV